MLRNYIFDNDEDRELEIVTGEDIVHHSGNGKLTIYGDLQPFGVLNITGSGDVFIMGNVCSKAIINFNGTGTLTIEGEIWTEAEINFYKNGNLIINGIVQASQGDSDVVKFHLYGKGTGTISFRSQEVYTPECTLRYMFEQGNGSYSDIELPSRTTITSVASLSSIASHSRSHHDAPSVKSLTSSYASPFASYVSSPYASNVSTSRATFFNSLAATQGKLEEETRKSKFKSFIENIETKKEHLKKKIKDKWKKKTEDQDSISKKDDDQDRNSRPSGPTGGML